MFYLGLFATLLGVVCISIPETHNGLVMLGLILGIAGVSLMRTPRRAAEQGRTIS